MTQNHLLLVDASGFVFRAWYAWPPVYRNSDGQPIGAVLGFMSMIWRVLGAAEADRPTHAAAVFDAPGQKFRHKIYAAYKSNRPSARSLELDRQWAYIRHAAETMGLTPVEKKGYEADDLIATYAIQAMKAGWRSTIVSSDKDFAQLVVDDKIEIIDPMQKKRIREADVEKRFGVRPKMVPDVQALAGDAVDGIPGISGLGLQKAAALVRAHGNVEMVIDNANEIRWPSVRAELKRRKEDVRTFKKLTVLKKNVGGLPKLETLLRAPVMKSHLQEILRAIEAESRYASIFNTDPQLIRVVDALPKGVDQWEWWTEELLAPGQQIPDEPQSGYYQRRLVRGGDPVPAKIWREPEVDALTGEESGKDWLRCQLGNRFADPVAEWPRLAMSPIKREDYAYEQADAQHARAHRPNDPKAKPNEPVNLLKAPAPVAPRRRRA